MKVQALFFAVLFASLMAAAPAIAQTTPS